MNLRQQVDRFELAVESFAAAVLALRVEPPPSGSTFQLFFHFLDFIP